MLGMEYKMQRLSTASLQNVDLEQYREVVEQEGVRCRIGDAS